MFACEMKRRFVYEFFSNLLGYLSDCALACYLVLVMLKTRKPVETGGLV